jgi:hypothetical protein
MSFGSPPALLALIVAIAAASFEPGSAFAQEMSPAEQAKVLENFFKLGLPDSRNAKWVKARLPEDYDAADSLPGGESEPYTGNAWLVREENGVVELIRDHVRRVRVRRVSGEDEETRDKLPGARIKDADLDADVKTLIAALKSGRANTGGPVHSGGQYLMGDEAQPANAASALLFAAHLQRQGRTEQAQEIVRAALAFTPGPASLDFAISKIADGRLQQLNEEYFAKRDHAAYARAIEKLATEFPRSWPQRDAALLLAKRAAAQKPGKMAGDPAAKKAADFLLSLRKEQAASLPVHVNWLLPAGDDASLRARHPRYYNVPGLPIDDVAEPLPDFFKQPRSAFAGLARLLDDRRLLTLSHEDIPGRGEISPHLEREYANLDRPLELGELAWALIKNVLPGDLRSDVEDEQSGRMEKVLAWFATIAAMSDDELAWSFLRQSDAGSDEPALTFLVQKGNAESQKLLADVFLDLAVWSRHSPDPMLRHVEEYVARLGAAGPAFGEKLRPVVAAALQAQVAERLDEFGEPGAEQRQTYERQANMTLKKFDEIFKPQGLGEMLAELAGADKDTWMGSWEMRMAKVETTPWAEAEPQLFQTAAKAKDPAVRFDILLTIGGHEVALFVQPGQGERAAKETTPAKLDAATQSALETLLSDETPLPEQNSEGTAKDFSDFAALVFTQPRLPVADRDRWQAELRRIPEFALGWLKSQARAIIAGKPLPPMPSAARVRAGRAQEIFKEVAALPPEKILVALLAKNPDEQAAVADAKPDEWPRALREASLTIMGVNAADEEHATLLNLARWKGRKFDEALHKEITDAVEKAALADHGCEVNLSSIGLFGGLHLRAAKKRVASADQPQGLSRSGQIPVAQG